MTKPGATVTQLEPRRSLTPSTARQLTDSIKEDMESVWTRLLNAYTQGAHTTLGYASWSDYCKAEFGTGRTRSYQLLDAGRVVEAIGRESTNRGLPSNEFVARELVPVLKEKGEEAVVAVWEESVKRHGKPTAEQVEEVARAMGDKPEPEPEPKPEPTPERRLTKKQQQLGRAIRHVETQCEYISAILAARTSEEKAHARQILDVDDETHAEWSQSIKAIDNTARQLRRRVVNRRIP